MSERAVPPSKIDEAGESLVREAQYFLAREAWLLDHEEFDRWLELLDPRIRYFAPVRSSVRRDSTEPSDVAGHLAHFDDTIQTLTMRVARLKTGQAWSEDPRSRIRRFLSAVVLLGRDGDDPIIGSNILIHREGADQQSHSFSAYREDRFCRNSEQTLSLKERTIWIDHLAPRPLTLLF
jgi:3-phenylpropionate/cinnamic acid dioxygenase small subunit